MLQVLEEEKEMEQEEGEEVEIADSSLLLSLLPFRTATRVASCCD